MSQFDGVSIVKKANVYFDGKVTSRVVLFEDGSKKTLGVMLAGEYNFDTADKEIMEVLGGEMTIRIAGQDEWVTYNEGSSYEVPANSSFEIKVPGYVDYCCSYIKAC